MLISIDGHDRTGKSTLANYLSNLLPAKVPIRITYFSNRVPKNQIELIEWLKYSSVEEIVREHIIMHKNREEDCSSSIINYIIDRGYKTLLGSSLATIVNRKKCDVIHAYKIFEKLRDEVNYNPKKSIELFLYMHTSLNKCIKTIEARNGSILEGSYRGYMRLFVQYMQLIVMLNHNTHIINSLESQEKVFENASIIIKRYLNK